MASIWGLFNDSMAISKTNVNNRIVPEGGILVLSSIAFSGLLSSIDANLAAIWLLSNAAGFVLQRSRFCFASGFRDLFLFGSGANMKGIIVGLIVSSIGFTAIMHWITPLPGLGDIPSDAHVFPLGVSTIIGGILFGFGMVVGGGCVSGTLYRLGEGYVTSLAAMIGIMLGTAGLIASWNWWYVNVIEREPVVWLPQLFDMGYFGALGLTVVAIGVLFVFVNWWEARNAIPTIPVVNYNDPAVSLREKLTLSFNAICRETWSPSLGGAVLGGLSIVMFIVHKPFGVTGGIFELTSGTLMQLGIGPAALEGLDELGGCIGLGGDTILTTAVAMTVGTVAGSFIASILAGEFKIRISRDPLRYAQSLLGGIVMGYGSGLALGCTIGSLFSAIPSLSLSGWLFGMSLTVGSSIGTKIIRRMI